MTVVHGTPPPDYPPPVVEPVAPARPEPVGPPKWSEPLRTPEWSESAPPEPVPPPAPTAQVQAPPTQWAPPKPWTPHEPLTPSPLTPPPPPPPPPPPEPVRPPRQPEPAFADEPRQPRRSRSGAYVVPEESAAPVRGPAASKGRPRLHVPVGPILGGVALLGVVALLAVVFRGKKATPAPPAVVVIDSARARARADSIATYAPTPTVGWVRVIGDLPDDAVIWLDANAMKGVIFQASPGVHALEVETGEFQPWEKRIRVLVGDTVKVYVELALKQLSDSTPSR